MTELITNALWVKPSLLYLPSQHLVEIRARDGAGCCVTVFVVVSVMLSIAAVLLRRHTEITVLSVDTFFMV